MKGNKVTVADRVVPANNAARPSWLHLAYKEIRRLAHSGRPFTVADLYAKIGHPDDTHEPNGKNNQVGGVFQWAVKDGLIEPIGFQPARTEHRRGGIVRVWRGRRQ